MLEGVPDKISDSDVPECGNMSKKLFFNPKKGQNMSWNLPIIMKTSVIGEICCG